ncbi:transporter substrate-binding domain-containing protein [Hoeflea sp.]|uniref:transporter substrate-binding domain-containing protein n=1 Tax=Hoeflea sp. TaxID=1940281 RepID=UPI003B011DB4
MKRLFGTLCAALVCMSAVAGETLADTYNSIKERGKLVVGVKADYRPWGYRDPSGELVGLEIDMANDLANTLGVELELVPVVGSNRMEFLNQEKIDIIIATMGDNMKRRKVVTMIEPNYYAGGTNIIAKKETGFENWTDLKSQKICGIQGAYYNRRVLQLYEIDLVAFKGVPEAVNALKQGSCVGFVYDNTWIEKTLAEGGEWEAYEMPFETEDPSVWAIGVRHEDAESPFGLMVKGKVADWHRTGWLLEHEQKWGINQSPFLLEMNQALRTRAK